MHPGMWRPGWLPLPSRFGARSRSGRFHFRTSGSGTHAGGMLAAMAAPPNPAQKRRPPPSPRPILPEPRARRETAGRFALVDGLPIVLRPESTEADLVTARRLCDRLAEQTGRSLVIETHARTDGLGPAVVLARGDAEGRAGDAYRIDVSASGIRLEAGGAAGLRWATETLGQWIDARGRVPIGHVEDRPDFELRGFMLDVSRGKVPTLETLCELVDACASLKLNVLMLYVEHTFRFRRHPRIGEHDSPLLAEEIRTLDAYAAANHVQLVPSLQSLGHMEHVLALDPYRPLAETDAGWTISPVLPGTRALLGDLYDELLPNFRSRLFNANCDEPWDLPRGRSAEREAERGPGGVFVDHVHAVQSLARAHGKRTMIWADVVHAHPERVAELDEDLVFLDWWYEAELDFDRVRVFAENGRDFVVCPGTASWNCLFPRVGTSVANVARWADAGRRHGALGLLDTDWGDNGHFNLQGLSFFGMAWAAQHAWSGDTPAQRFDRAFSRLRFGDATGAVARLYRALGAVHDLGFPFFNGSGVQAVFFEPLDEPTFVDHAKPARVRAARRKLERGLDRLQKIAAGGVDDPLTLAEMEWAARASLFACEKAEAGLEELAWRRAPDSLRAAERRRLAGRLRRLAETQLELRDELERLWMTRSLRSNVDDVLDRVTRSVRSITRAARRLESNRPGRVEARAELTPKRMLRALNRIRGA